MRRICPYCQEAFITDVETKIYCSKWCGMRKRKASSKRRKSEKRPCIGGCGRTAAKWRRYCSEECGRNRTCQTCGEKFAYKFRVTGVYNCRGCKGIHKFIPSRKINKNGYVEIKVKPGRKRVMEHTFVIEGLIGRKLKKHESVHHKNGIRHDNRPENLELWVSGIRYGQRASDVRCHRCGEPYLISDKIVPPSAISGDSEAILAKA